MLNYNYTDIAGLGKIVIALIGKIVKNHKARAKKDDFINAWNRILQFEPIRFNLILSTIIHAKPIISIAAKRQRLF